MKYAEVQKKKKADLEKLLADRQQYIRELNFKIAANQLADVREAREIKKDIAKIQTRLKDLESEKSIEEVKE